MNSTKLEVSPGLVEKMIRSELNTRSSSNLAKENVAAIFPCNEMQQAFYLLSQHSKNDPGVIVAEVELAGILHENLFVEAWNQEVARHESLRMSVRPKKDQTPMLVVWKKLIQQIEFHQEASLNSREFKSRLRRQINLAEPPISKVFVNSLDTNRHQLLWAFHHLLLDGWSTAVVLRDVVDRYHSLVAGNIEFASPVKPAYKEYYQASEQLNYWEAREFWANELKGFGGCPEFKSFDSGAGSTGLELPDVSATRKLTATDSDRLEGVIRTHGVTAGVLSSAAWSLLLHRLFDRDDIVFGQTVSGRNVALEGIHNFVGLLANVVPVRSQLESTTTVGDWLLKFRKQQFNLQRFEYLPSSQFHELCEIGPNAALFETLLVVENFVQSTDSAAGELRIEGFSSGATSNYPVTAYVIPGQSWQIRIDVQPGVAANRELADFLADNLIKVLEQYSQSLESETVGQIANAIDTCSFELGKPPKIEPQHDIHVEYSETEIRLASIWESVVGVAEVLPSDNFFDLGGKSLTALRVCSGIEKAFGVKYPPTVLVEFPILQQLASQISSGQARDPNLTFFNQVDSDDLVICLHIGVGYATYYRHLARNLEQFRVLAVHSNGHENGHAIRSFERLAEYLADKLDDHVRGKRVHLVGYCMGAKFSVELSEELERRGHPVHQLIFVDSAPDWTVPQYSWDDFIRHSNSSFKGTVKYLKRGCKRGLQWGRYRIAQWRGDTKLVDDYEGRRLDRQMSQAFTSYNIEPIKIPTRLIRSSRYEDSLEKEYHLRWRDYAHDFQYCVIDGVHEQILLEPGVRQVANVLREIIAPENHSANSTIWRN